MSHHFLTPEDAARLEKKIMEEGIPDGARDYNLPRMTRGLIEKFISGELLGYRGWLVGRDSVTGELRLRSMVAGFVWPPHTYVQAGYFAPADLASRKQIHDLGYYAFKNESGSRAHLSPWGDLIVTGTVELWGTVHEHDYGWRAEYAYPKSFDGTRNIGSDRLLLEELRKIYL